MRKLSIADAAEYFKVSKEAIHNRIRRGSLESIIENGVKFVKLADDKKQSSSDDLADSKYTQYIEQENIRLREKVDNLEKETTRLRDIREQSLIDERVRIEQIYKERDAQLRSVLNVVATKFLAHVNTDNLIKEAKNADAITADVVDDSDNWIRLKHFLKLKNLDSDERKRIKKEILAIADSDERFEIEDDKIYLNPSIFDYSDILQ